MHSATEAERYLLGPEDQLRITIHGREGLSGDYRVRTDGSVSIPTLGNFKLDGKDTYDVERLISDRLPGASVVVDVIQRRPFYILGRVSRPGSYPYVPGMTVLHAVAYGGGLPRLTSNTAGLSMTMLSRIESRNRSHGQLVRGCDEIRLTDF